MAPFLMEANAPPDFASAPQRTCSRAGGSLTIVIRTSAAAAASLGEEARRAPAATKESAREAVRFQTTSGKPALRRLCPMGRPMRPRPMRLTVGCGTSASERCNELDERRGKIVTRGAEDENAAPRRLGESCAVRQIQFRWREKSGKSQLRRAQHWLAVGLGVARVRRQ